MRDKCSRDFESVVCNLMTLSFDIIHFFFWLKKRVKTEFNSLSFTISRSSVLLSVLPNSVQSTRAATPLSYSFNLRKKQHYGQTYVTSFRPGMQVPLPDLGFQVSRCEKKHVSNCRRMLASFSTDAHQSAIFNSSSIGIYLLTSQLCLNITSFLELRPRPEEESPCWFR